MMLLLPHKKRQAKKVVKIQFFNAEEINICQRKTL